MLFDLGLDTTGSVRVAGDDNVGGWRIGVGVLAIQGFEEGRALDIGLRTFGHFNAAEKESAIRSLGRVTRTVRSF